MSLAVGRTAEAILPPQTEAMRRLVGRVDARRVALMGEQQLLRDRYDEVMRWANPPWDPSTRRLNPRPETATAARRGIPKAHVDQVGQVVLRWSVLELGAMPKFRVDPPYVPSPLLAGDPQKDEVTRRQYDLDRMIAQNQASQMENQTREWLEDAYAHQTLLWGAWAKNAFGKAILRDGWDYVEARPTLELIENPTHVYCGWTQRNGPRRLSWVIVADEMSPEECNLRFGLAIPTDSRGSIDTGAWGGVLDQGESEWRGEQSESLRRMVWVQEYWELVREPLRIDVDGRVLSQTVSVWNTFIVAGRVVQGPIELPWKRLPFHVWEDQHIPTYMHSKSMAENAIGLNEMYDDMLDRQHQVIEFESGPRYKGMNMGHNNDKIRVPDPFEAIPLREGEDILQLDTRVDFFPTQLHAGELRESMYDATGLTPIAWGRSPNAQTSGRALSAEWRAVELPLASKLINTTPTVRDVVMNWWDYAEAESDRHAAVAKGHRRFTIIWEPLDIRDATERRMDVINRLNANLIDPETAIEECGYENVDEIMAKIKAYLVDPVWNPLRYQQLLVLRQLAAAIEMQELQLAQAKQAAGIPPEGAEGQASDAAAQGEQAAVQNAQQPGVEPTEAMNQPGQGPGNSGMSVDTQMLSRSPIVGGSGNQIVASIPVSTGQVPR